MMSAETVPPSLLAACEAMLREVAQFPMSAERLQDAGPLIGEIVAAIREMDAADVEGVEPATVFGVAR